MRQIAASDFHITFHERAYSMKIVLASRNAHKIKELENFLRPVIQPLELLSLNDIQITEEIEETGTTFEENAVIKARAAASRGYIGIADDSGLEVDVLGGEPGVYSARYAGEPCDDARNNEQRSGVCFRYRLRIAVAR